MLALSESSSLPSLKPEQSCLFLPHFYQSFITGGPGCWWLKLHFCRAAFEYGYIIHKHVYPELRVNKHAQVHADACRMCADRRTNTHKAAMGAEEENLQEAGLICRQNTHAGLNAAARSPLAGVFHIYSLLCDKDLIHEEFGLEIYIWWILIMFWSQNKPARQSQLKFINDVKTWSWSCLLLLSNNTNQLWVRTESRWTDSNHSERFLLLFLVYK